MSIAVFLENLTLWLASIAWLIPYVGASLKAFLNDSDFFSSWVQRNVHVEPDDQDVSKDVLAGCKVAHQLIDLRDLPLLSAIYSVFLLLAESVRLVNKTPVLGLVAVAVVIYMIVYFQGRKVYEGSVAAVDWNERPYRALPVSRSRFVSLLKFVSVGASAAVVYLAKQL